MEFRKIDRSNYQECMALTVARKMYAKLGFRELQETEYTYNGILFREMQMVKAL